MAWGFGWPSEYMPRPKQRSSNSSNSSSHLCVGTSTKGVTAHVVPVAGFSTRLVSVSVIAGRDRRGVGGREN